MPKAVAPIAEPIAARMSSQEKRLTEMMAVVDAAATLGLMCTPVDLSLKWLGGAFAVRLVRRSTEKTIYQTCQLIQRNIPKAIAESWLPPSLIVAEELQRIKWETTSVADVLLMAEPLLQASPSDCAGLTKTFRTASERVIRLVACIRPGLDAEWVRIPRVQPPTGHLKMTYQYVLLDADGELFPPKDGERNDVELEEGEEEALREQVVADLLVLADQGAKLAPGFLRSMGREEVEEADEVEEQLQNPNPVVAVGQGSSSTNQPKAPKRQKADTTMYEVACIVDEVLGSKPQQPRYRVQWAATGYTKEWEEYRDSG